jgi:non-ribosomal peptide synthetase component F
LAGEVPVLNPGYDFYRSNLESKESGEYRCVIPGQVIRDLKQIAGDHNASLFMALLTGFFMLCAHISGQDDILVGTPGAGRQHDDLKTIIGFFVNTLIIRNKIDFAESFGDFLKRVRENTLQTLEYQGYPLELICGELKIEYPKIPVFFNMLNITELDRDQLKDLSSYHIESVQDAKFDIACYLREYENGVEINVHYYKALFKPLTIEKMMGMYIKLLENISADPGKILREYYSRKKRIRVSSLPGSMESHV